MSRASRLFPLLCAVVFSGRSQTVTFSDHIAPIIYANCSKCHRPGQIGPFPLMSYSDVRSKALTIGAVTQAKFMPPWKPEPGWISYRNERRLTPEQISLIQQWLIDGAPEGDPAKAPSAPVFTDDWTLGPPDLILEMPQSFDIPADGPDIYRNFAIASNITEDKWVRAIELRPMARSVLHHALFFADPGHGGQATEKKVTDGKAGFPGLGSVFTAQLAGVSDLSTLFSGGLGGWVPGTTPAFLPSGFAAPMPKGSDVLVQIHFHPDGRPHTEKAVIGLYFGPKPARTITQIQVPAVFGFWGNINIPAGTPDYKLRGSFTLPADVDALVVTSHQHYLGRDARMTATLPDGEVKILLWIRSWDFNWQDQYQFQSPVFLPKGTRIDGELTYDNSTSNPRNPSLPPKTVTWGEQSTDEMGSLIMTVSPRQESDLSALLSSIVQFSLTPVPQVGNRPLFVSSGLVDGASTQPGAVTPGRIVVLYGSRLGPETLTASQPGLDGHLSGSVAGTQVLFDGRPAPLLYTSSRQLAAVVPYSVDGKAGTQVQVRNGPLASDLVALPVTPAAPSIFSADYTGSGQGAILNEDGITVNSKTNPAARGSVISIFATGEGQTTPGGVDGQIMTPVLSARPVLPVQVRIGGRAAEVQYSGSVPGQVAGLFQLNARIPDGTPSGEIPVEVQVGSATSQPGITVMVR